MERIIYFKYQIDNNLEISSNIKSHCEITTVKSLNEDYCKIAGNSFDMPEVQSSNNAPNLNIEKESLSREEAFKKLSKSFSPDTSSKLQMKTSLKETNKVLLQDESFQVQNFIQRFKEMKNQKRFIFVRNLGEGTFGYVIECLDSKRKRLPVAIKVSKNIYTEKLNSEVKVLKKIFENYNSPHNPCVTLIMCFTLESRLCLVFQRCGDNLFTFMKKRRFEPLQFEFILQITYQILNATLFLHEKCDLIHTDFKPENIVLCSPIYITKSERGIKENLLPSKFDIKIIDFGNALPNKGLRYTKMIGTRHYRAVEVILGKPWNYKIDYWSIGCVLYELYTGKMLFTAKNDSLHLACIDKIIGSIGREMTKTSRKAHLFLRNGRFNKLALEDYSLIEEKEPIEDHFKHSSHQSQIFTRFLVNLLQINPDKRTHLKDIIQSFIFSKIPDYLKRKYKNFICK